MTAREKFKIGDRVRLNAAGLKRPRQARVPTTGRVVGFGQSPEAIRILRDGRRTVVGAYADWWEVDAAAQPPQPDLDRVARKLVTALYLYPGYTVGSRGPSGCIMDALAEVAPDVAAEIREGVEPGDIFQRRWPER